MSRSCSLCDDETASETFHVGAKCASRLGLRPMPPPRRPPIPCARCNAMLFVRVMPREYTAWGKPATGGDVVLQLAAPMTLTNQPHVAERRLLHGRTVEDANILDGLGTVEAYVCAKCGYIDWYCQDPQAMPIGHEFNTELVDYTSETPYR